MTSTSYARSPDELVRSVMNSRLLTIGPDASLTEAAHEMADRRVGAILVTEGDDLVGILTERDVLRAVGRGSIEGTVRDWMTRGPDTISSATTIGEAAGLMVHGGYRHLPIVEGGRLVGIVSIRDLIQLHHEAPSGV